jgi:hypothetical protein
MMECESFTIVPFDDGDYKSRSEISRVVVFYINIDGLDILIRLKKIREL